MIRNARFHLLALASATWLAGGACAQVGPPAAPKGEATADAGSGEIVVTAQRRSQRLRDVPISITAVSGDELARAGVTTIRDLSTLVSGFTTAGQGFTVQPALRGVSSFLTEGIGDPPNAIYLDDIYQSSGTALGAELPDIERIEVLKGPQGTLFGRNATGGAVRVFTRGPSFDTHADIAMQLGAFTGAGSSRASANIRTTAFVTGGLVPGLVAGSLSASYRHTPGYFTDDADGGRTGRIRKASVRGKLLVTPADNLEIVAAAYYLSGDNLGETLQAPYRGLTAASAYPGSVVPSRSWHAAFSRPMDYVTLDQKGANLHAALKLDPGTISLITGYNRIEVHTATSIVGARGSLACLATFACIDYNFRPVTKTFSQEANFASRDFGPLSFTTGLFYYHERRSSFAYVQETLVPGGITVIDSSGRTNAYAAYGEATYKLTDRLSLTGGARYNHEKLRDDPGFGLPDQGLTSNAVTPRAVLAFKPDDRLNLYASYSRGFKSGITGARNPASTPPFQAIKPEKIDAYEAGAKYGSGNLSASLAGFYYDYRDKQEQSFTGTTTVLINTGKVRIYGLDADLAFRPARGFSLALNVEWLPEAKYLDFPNAPGTSLIRDPGTGTFLPGRGLQAVICPPGATPGCVATGSATFDATGDRLPRAPKLSANATLGYRGETAGGIFDASATVSFSSRYAHEFTGTVVQGRYATLTAQAGYQFRGTGLRAGVYGRNLTNQDNIVGSINSGAGFLRTIAAPQEIGINLAFSY